MNNQSKQYGNQKSYQNQGKYGGAQKSYQNTSSASSYAAAAGAGGAGARESNTIGGGDALGKTEVRQVRLGRNLDREGGGPGLPDPVRETTGKNGANFSSASAGGYGNLPSPAATADPVFSPPQAPVPIVRTKGVNVFCSFGVAGDFEVYFRVYTSQDRYRHTDFGLTRVSNGVYVGGADVPVGRFEGKILFGRDKTEEHVIFVGYSHHARVFTCYEHTTSITMVVKDVVARSFGFRTQTECSHAQFLDGWSRLLHYTGDYFANESIELFRAGLLNISADMPVHSLSTWRMAVSTTSVKVLWERFARAANYGAHQPPTLIKFCLLLERIKELSPLDPSQNEVIMEIFHSFSPVELMNFLRTTDSSGFLPCLLGFVEHTVVIATQLVRPAAVPWSLFLNVFKANVQCVKSACERFPDSLRNNLNDFITFTPPENLSIIFGGLSCVCELKDFQSSTNTASKLSQFVLPIIRSSRYLKPVPRTDYSVQEFNSIMHFAKVSPSLHSALFDPSTKEPFQMAAVSCLSVWVIATTALFPALFDKQLPVKYQNRRVDEFVACVGASVLKGISTNPNDNPNEVNSCDEIYRVLSDIIETRPECVDWIRKIHSTLPTVMGDGLLSRLEAYCGDWIQAVVEMEAEAFDTICRSKSTDVRVFRQKYLLKLVSVTPNHARISELVSLSWREFVERERAQFLSEVEMQRLFSCVHEGGVLSSGDLSVLILTVDQIRQAFVSMQSEPTMYPELMLHPRYVEDYNSYQLTMDTLRALATAISTGKILQSTLEVLTSQYHLIKNLAEIIPDFDTRCVRVLAEKVARIRGEWQDVLTAFRDFMPEHPQFRNCSNQQSMSVVSKVAELNSLTIDVWESPAIGGKGMRDLADRLTRARRSLIYQWIWKQQCEREQDLEVSDVAAEAVDQWKKSIERSFVDWSQCVKQILSKEFCRELLFARLETIVADDPICADIPNDSIQAQDVAAKHLRQVRLHREECINIEVDTTISVLGGVQGVEKRPFFDVLMDFLRAVDFRQQSLSLQKLAEVQRCTLDPNDSLVRYNAIMDDPNSTVNDVIIGCNRVAAQYPKTNDILKGFPEALLTLIKENERGQYGLLDLFAKFGSVHLFKQIIDRIITSVDDKIHGVLVAFQGVREAFSEEIHGRDCYAQLTGSCLNPAAVLFEYLSLVSWSVSRLRLLIGSIDILMSVFEDGGASVTATIRQVSSLKSTGWFIISLPDGKMTARYTDLEKNEERSLNSVQLGDIPFQLCLTGNTRSGNDDDSELGVHTEQKQFLEFMERLNELASTLSELAVAGHPSYQDNGLEVPGSQSLVVLEGLINVHRTKLQKWHEFLARADEDLPLLTCFTRRQLVTSIRVLACRATDNPGYTKNTLVSLFKSVYPCREEAGTESIIARLLQTPIPQELNLNEVAKSVHELLRQGVGSLLPRTSQPPNRLSAAVNDLKRTLPERLKAPNDVVVCKIPYAMNHTQSETVTALYVSLFQRLPSVIEVFSCSPDTTELEVVDFIRRWSASGRFSNFLAPDQRKMMFAMFNTEKLKPNIQNVILAKVHEYRKNAAFPLVILMAPISDHEAIVAAGLRGDVISDNVEFVKNCGPVCQHYLRTNAPNVEVFSSISPSAGKTTELLETHVVPLPRQGAGVPRQKVPYARIPLTGNIDEIVSLLTNIEYERRAVCPGGRIVLHLNAANSLDVDLLNRFFFMFLVTRVIFDSNGNYVVRNAEDTIAIEWPYEGIIAQRAFVKCVLCQSFLQRQPVNQVDFLEYRFANFDGSNRKNALLHEVWSVDDPNLRIGIQMMLAFYNVPAGTFTMPYQQAICEVAIPAPQELYQTIETKLRELKVQFVSPAIVFRYMRFLCNQLVGLHNMWLYQYCSEETVTLDTIQGQPPEGHIINVLRLAYHFARCSHQLALDLAASAVQPMSEAFVDNDTRLESLAFSFSDWKGKNFLIFSGDGMPQMVSTSGDIFLDTVCSTDNDESFREYLKLQHRGRHGMTVDAMCCGLSDVNYDPVNEVAEDHSLRQLLAMIGEEDNFGFHIFEALKDIASGRNPNYAATAPITEIPNSALRRLRSISIQPKENEQPKIAAEELADTKEVQHFLDYAGAWLGSICGSYSDPSPPFILTVDNLCRLLAVKLRLMCKIPVVFMGETGCGKTHVVGFYSRVCGRLFEVVNIHGGMKPEDLLASIQEIISRVDGKPAVVLLDEVNSMPCVWTIKELVCEGFILGVRIPDNIRFICIMNPRRRRAPIAGNASGLASGLDFSPYQNKGKDQAAVQAVEVHETPLVYEVHRSPESIMSLVWDFGIPSESRMEKSKAELITHGRTPFPKTLPTITDESIFVENIVHWMITAKLPHYNVGTEAGNGRPTGLMEDFKRCNRAGNLEAHRRYLRALLCALVDRSQQFLRTSLNDCSAASLRDIQRAVSLIPFLINTQRRFVEIDPARAGQSEYLYFHFLNVAILVSITLNYGLRLSGADRQDYFQKVRNTWEVVREEHSVSIAEEFLPVPLDFRRIYSTFDAFAEDLCNCLSLEEGMAINEALKENVTSLFCSIMGNQDTGIAQFIVGRPGSSKSSSLDILCASTDPNSTDPRCKFFKSPDWFEVRKCVLQCTPDTTAADIMRVARSAASYQLSKRLAKDTCRCVIVLEEVGVTVGSKHNPLMVLHGLVDRGVLMEDGSHIKLPIVGVSNWRLDASKMNRMRATHRGNPSPQDLILTANCIIQSKLASGGAAVQFDEASFTKSLKQFANVFSRFVLGQENTSEEIKSLGWFYGMRDFYAFVQLLQSHHSLSLAKELKMPGANVIYDYKLDPHLVRWATKLAFGGHPDSRLENMLIDAINACFISGGGAQEAKWKRKESDDETHEKHICDMCCRVCYYTDIKTTETAVDDNDHRRHVFDQFNSRADRTGRNCNEMASTDVFPTLRILSYLLYVPLDSSSLCRTRHVLLFTKANAALHLLHSLKIVRKRNAVIVFGRREPTMRDILDDLLRVRRCMISGKTLILVGAKHIYESMYDSLNQHYTVEGEGESKRYFTRLTMNGYTASFPIHSYFRCIAIEQSSQATELLPPFINRFAKAHLNYFSALSVPQRNLFAKIQGNSLVKLSDKEGVDILDYLIPGFTVDTLHSLAFLFATDKLLTGEQLQKAETCAVARLAYLCSPRRLQHLDYDPENKFANARQTINSWNIAQRTHRLKDDYTTLVNGFSFDEEGDEAVKSDSTIKSSKNQHLFLLTEQRNIGYGNTVDNLRDIYNSCEPLYHDGFVDLNLIITDMELTTKLTALNQAASPSFLVAICDMTHQNAAEQLEKFLYLVNTTELDDTKHVVFVGMVRNSSVPNTPIDKFHLHFDATWCYLFLDEVDTFEQTETVVSLQAMLAPENTVVAELLDPIVMCEMIRFKSLSIAQRIDPSGKQLNLIQDQLHMTFGVDPQLMECGQVAEILCGRIRDQLATLEAVNDSKWKFAALMKIRNTHTLRQQLYLYLAALTERCLLQFATPLFAFGNFGNAVRGAPFEDLFSALLRSATVVPAPDLSDCPLVDLPFIVEWKDTNSADAMFERTADAVPVRFPFAFLLYHVLQPVAAASGEEGVFVRLTEILEERTIFPEEAVAYANDLLSQMGVEEEAPRAAFFNLLNAYFSCCIQESIPKLHGIIETQREIVEAAMRFVTNDQVRVAELAIPGITKENLGDALVKAATDNEGIVDLGSIYDITVLSEDSFNLELSKAVSVACCTSNDLALKRAGAELVRRCREGPKSLIKEFETCNSTAARLAKFLLPTIYRALSPEEAVEATVTLIRTAYSNFQLFPLPAVGFLVHRGLDTWIHQADAKAILDALADGINFNQNGADEPAGMLISRCLFDLCDDAFSLGDIIHKASCVEEINLRNILLSGSITRGLQFLGDRLKGKTGNWSPDDYINDEDANIISNQIQSSIEGTDLVKGCAEFFLRSLSSSGLEMDLAKQCIEADNPRTIPKCIFSHEVVQELIQPKQDAVSTLCVFADYAPATFAIRTSFGVAADQVADQITRFERLNELGGVAALLDLGYCLGADRTQDEINRIKLFLPSIHDPVLRDFADKVMNAVHPAVNSLSKEARKAWVVTVLKMLSCQNPINVYFSRMIKNEVTSAAVPFPQLPNDLAARLPVCAHQFFHSAAALAIACRAPQPVFDTVDLRRHESHIQNEILVTKTPCCSKPMGFWDGCFAVVCETCQGNFCGFCMAKTVGDAHSHVYTCPRNPKQHDYFSTFAVFRQLRNADKLVALRNYLDNQCDPRIRGAVLASTLPHLRDLEISTDTLGASAGFSIDLSAQRIGYAGNFIKASCFTESQTDDPAFVWLQGLALLHFAEVDTPCNNEAAISTCFAAVVAAAGAPAGVVDAVKKRDADAQGEVTGGLAGVLSWDNNYQTTIDDMTDSRRRAFLPNHFRFRRQHDDVLAKFHHQVRENPDFALLKFLLDNEDSFAGELQRMVVEILGYVGDLVRVCYLKQVTTKMAENVTLGQLATEFDSLGGERLRTFCNNIQVLFKHVQRFECKERKDLDAAFGHLVLDATLPVINLLPRGATNPLGVSLTNVIYHGVAPQDPPLRWKSLGKIQNETVASIRSMFKYPERSAKSRPFKLSPAEVATFNVAELYDNLSLFIDPQPVAELTEDILSLQHIVAHSEGLWGKPAICEELPEFKFSDEHRHTVFGFVASKISLKFMRPKLQNMVRLAIQQYPEFRASVMAFLTILALEVINRPLGLIPPLLNDLAHNVTIPLTEEQDRGKVFLGSPIFEKELHTAHIVPLCAQLWDGAVIPKACVDLEDADRDELTALFTAMCVDPVHRLSVPNLRLGIRLVGIQRLSTSQSDAFLAAPLSVYLEGVLDDKYDSYWDDTCLATIPAKHFFATFELAERLLSGVLIEDGDADSHAEFEVPLSRLQPNRVYTSPFLDLGVGASAGAGVGGANNNINRANSSRNTSNANTAHQHQQQQQPHGSAGGGGQQPATFKWQKADTLFMDD
jgi:hypothetical protein